MPLHYTLAPSKEIVQNYFTNQANYLANPNDNSITNIIPLTVVDPKTIVTNIRSRMLLTCYDLPFIYENKDPWEGFLKFEKDQSFGIGIGVDFHYGTMHLPPLLQFLSEHTEEISKSLGKKIKLIAASNIPYGYGMCEPAIDEPTVVLGIGGLCQADFIVPFQAFYYMMVNYYHMLSHIYQANVILTESRDAMVHQASVAASMVARAFSDWHYLKDFFHYSFEIDAEYSGWVNTTHLVSMFMEANPEHEYRSDIIYEYLEFKSKMPGYFIPYTEIHRFFKRQDFNIGKIFGQANGNASMRKPLTYGKPGKTDPDALSDIFPAVFHEKDGSIKKSLDPGWKAQYKDFMNIPTNNVFLNVLSTYTAKTLNAVSIVIPAYDYFLSLMAKENRP